MKYETLEQKTQDYNTLINDCIKELDLKGCNYVGNDININPKGEKYFIINSLYNNL